MPGWFRALMPKEDVFFVLFERHAQTIVDGSKALKNLLDGGVDFLPSCREPTSCGAPHHLRRQHPACAKQAIAAGDPLEALRLLDRATAGLAAAK